VKNQIRYLQNLFYDLLNDYGQVYVAVRHSENSFIGDRGFTDEEKEKGLVLVFNKKNHKDLQWTEDGSIIAALGFGMNNRPEKCFLHVDDIVSVFSPLAKIRFDRWDTGDSEKGTGQPRELAIQEAKKSGGENIVSLDQFRKSKT
jgi:hypothetical protein